MRIYNVYICNRGLPSSGGEKFTYEIIPRFAQNHYTVNFFGFNPIAEEWSKCDNVEVINVLKKQPKLLEKIKVFELFFYFEVFFKSLKFLIKFPEEESIIISHSDAWPDVIFSYFLKLKNPKAYWAAINHMILPSPWKGYKYVYTNKWKWPSLFDIYGWLNQRIFFLFQKKADLLISINSNDEEYLVNKNKNVLIIKHGREYLGEISKVEKLYDVCFLGRFYDQKGIAEIPEILSKLSVINKNNLSIIFIGQENGFSNRLKKELESKNLENFKIKFLGPKYGEEKYDLLKKTKVMILPSYFESFAIVYLDAIGVGIPVVEYDLPCYYDHKYGALKVFNLDNDAFARAIDQLLEDNQLYQRLSLEGYQYSKEFSWEKTAETIIDKISFTRFKIRI